MCKMTVQSVHLEVETLLRDQRLWHAILIGTSTNRYHPSRPKPQTNTNTVVALTSEAFNCLLTSASLAFNSLFSTASAASDRLISLALQHAQPLHA